jgi:hypothetical protein
MKSIKGTAPVKVVFIAFQLLLVFFYIRHQSTLIEYSFLRQKNEQKKIDLINKQRDLKHTLHASHSLSHIKEFAQEAHMSKITLHQIKTVPDECPTA